ncbi:MAG: Ig-like domain-containing protein, partial [Fusobacteria bacterium]|nr:Ig-like domain-containing protein [Fusobacteriota bacterium]
SLPPSQLTATASDPGPVTWSSSNTAVATVNSTGLVTFVSAGTATITATQSSTNLKATCAVTVTQPIITLTKSDIVSYVGQKYTNITVQSTQGGTITWSSSNPSVVSVAVSGNKGNLTYNNAGTATITVTQGNATATCNVDVNTAETIQATPNSVSGRPNNTINVTFTSDCTWSNMHWMNSLNDQMVSATLVSQTENSITYALNLMKVGNAGTVGIDNSAWGGAKMYIPVTVTN